MEFNIKVIIELAVLYLALFIMVFFMLVLIQNMNRIFKKPRPDKRWKPRISVIIPAYNEEKNLERCVLSVINADYPKRKLEIIIVDDGSKDRTYRVAKELHKRYPGIIKVYRKKNSGKADSLNMGIEKASGEIIATLDADSYITPKAIEKMLPYFKEKGVMAVTAAVKASNREGFLERLQAVEYIYTLFSRKVMEFIEAIYVTPGPFSMFRAELFKEIGGFDRNNILEDQEMAMRIQSYNYKIRSSLDADVYTEVPRTFGELLKQRIRWHRGGLRNSYKYFHLISPKYGDLGLIVLPIGFLSVLAIFAVLFVFVYTRLYSMPVPFTEHFLFLAITPTIIIGIALLLLNILWIYFGLRVFRNEKIDLPMVLVYIFSYAYLISIFWISAIAKELRLEKLRW
jgi:cellulose synthase/poly-beta-1,6-N-acetylglucosamine synthase-like glycosyltransferase